MAVEATSTSGPECERGQQSHHHAQGRQQNHRGLHAHGWLVRMRVGQIAGRAIEEDVVHQPSRVGDAAKRRKGGDGGHDPAPSTGLGKGDGLGQEHLFGQKSVEKRHARHGGGGGHGQRSGPGHQAPKPAQFAHVSGAGFMVNDAGGHEQRGLERRVIQDVKDGRDCGQRRAQPNQECDEAQVTDGRVGQQALEVLPKQRNKGGKRHGHQTGGGHDGHEELRAANDGCQARQQENACLHHGGRVQVGRHRSGRGHGLRQPEVEGELRTFGKAAHQNQEQGDGVVGVSLNAGRIGQHVADFIGTSNLAQQNEATEHGQATTAGDGECHAGAVTGVGTMIPVPHQQKRGNAGELPKHHHEQQVVRQHNAQHGGHEQHQGAVKLANGVIFAQVTVGVHNDQKPMPVISMANMRDSPSSLSPRFIPISGTHSTKRRAVSPAMTAGACISSSPRLVAATAPASHAVRRR